MAAEFTKGEGSTLRSGKTKPDWSVVRQSVTIGRRVWSATFLLSRLGKRRRVVARSIFRSLPPSSGEVEKRDGQYVRTHGTHARTHARTHAAQKYCACVARRGVEKVPDPDQWCACLSARGEKPRIVSSRLVSSARPEALIYIHLRASFFSCSSPPSFRPYFRRGFLRLAGRRGIERRARRRNESSTMRASHLRTRRGSTSMHRTCTRRGAARRGEKRRGESE